MNTKSLTLACAAMFALLGESSVAEENEHAHHVMPPSQTVPGESIYQLPVTLTDQSGQTFKLSQLRGKPLLVTMLYTSCDSVCPLLAQTVNRTYAALPSDTRGRLQVLMVSFDPARDTPKSLADFGRTHGLEKGWKVARTSADEVRELAAVLGIRYRELSNGVFSHSAVITLVDEQGVIRARTESLNQLDPAFMKTLAATVTKAVR